MDEAVLNDTLDNDELSDKYLIFSVNSIDFGVEIENINEIISYQDIDPVPHSLPFLRGIISIRGTIVPVIDMRVKFGYEPIEHTDRTCIVVLTYGVTLIGIVVDEVRDVLSIPANLLHDPPSANTRDANKYIKKIVEFEGTVRQIIDSQAVFDIVLDAT